MTKEELLDFILTTKYTLGVYITNLHPKHTSEFSYEALRNAHKCLELCEKFIESKDIQ